MIVSTVLTEYESRMSLNGLCTKQTVIAIVVNGDKNYVGLNACENPQETCPRLDDDDYEKCASICQQKCHAEVDALNKAGRDSVGSTLFIIGHNRICNSCFSKAERYGVKEIIIIGDFHVSNTKFKKEILV